MSLPAVEIANHLLGNVPGARDKSKDDQDAHYDPGANQHFGNLAATDELEEIYRLLQRDFSAATILHVGSVSRMGSSNSAELASDRPYRRTLRNRGSREHGDTPSRPLT